MFVFCLVALVNLTLKLNQFGMDWVWTFSQFHLLSACILSTYGIEAAVSNWFRAVEFMALKLSNLLGNYNGWGLRVVMKYSVWTKEIENAKLNFQSI